MFKLSDYAYDLPKDRIAQHPVEHRTRSRLFCINRGTNLFSHENFSDITTHLNPGDVLVVNDTKVVPARLWGKKPTGGVVEILIIDYALGMQQLSKTGFFQCDCLMKASRHPKEGDLIELGDNVQAEVVRRKGYLSEVRFLNGQGIVEFIKEKGQVPLPPYIQRNKTVNQSDQTDYQTVYARHEGAVAAPTAGLHFSDGLLAEIKKNEIQVVPITLHVGYGTFVPVRVDDIRKHQIHSEFFTLSQQSAQKINDVKTGGGRVIAVGTTSVRTLEYLSDETGMVTATAGECDLFIYPGYAFKCVDAMITNFHLPESTLLMLVSAFYSRKGILKAYKEAVKRRYRFFSYGDAMLIE